MQHYVTSFDILVLALTGCALVLSFALLMFSIPARKPGWIMLAPAPLHWAAVLLCTALFVFIGYIWLFVGSSRPDGASQMRIAFWLCAIFGIGGVIAAYQTLRIMQASLSFRGSEIALRKSGRERQMRMEDVMSGERRWGGEFRFRFSDGTVLDVDPYSRNADKLIERLGMALA